MSANLKRKGRRPPTTVGVRKLIALSCDIKISGVDRLVLSQSTRVADRQTDRQKFPRRASIAARAVMKNELENVAINDVLPLKAARGDAIANLKCFWDLGHQIPNFDGYDYIHYAAPPYLACISAIYFLPFGNVWLGSVSGCNA